MNIALITPAKKYTKSGNRTSAVRWAAMLRELGHRIEIATDSSVLSRRPIDLMVALHAWRSHAAVEAYRQQYPDGPLIVALGGTDVNTYLTSHPAQTLKSMNAADALVCLHDLVGARLPKRLRPRLRVIRQSARPSSAPRVPRKRTFDVCVVGHLRKEKDPFRAALAARLLPETSRIQVTHLGKAHKPEWAARARKEQARNPRYRWLNERPHWQVRREYARARLMVISSNQEGGANVVSEAVVAGLPVIASDIDGNRGLLGEKYAGYYPVGNEVVLAALLLRAENEPAFLQKLTTQCAKLEPTFSPQREAAAWGKVIAQVMRKIR